MIGNRIIIPHVKKYFNKRTFKTVMSSSEALVETLKAYKVEKTFGIVGSAIMNPLHSFPTAGIEFVSVQHEQNAVHMADGYARRTGKHGVCISQNGPGITNMVTGVATAFYAHSPVVLITPQASNKTFGHGMFQEVEQLSMFSKITKYQVQVNDQCRIAEELANCLHYAKLYNGPTQLNIPREYLYGVPMEYTINGPKNINIQTPANPFLAKQAFDLLQNAKKPVILVGGGITDNGRDSVVKFAESLSIGVATTYLHNDSFPSDHPLYTGSLGYMGSQAAMKLISSADVIFAVGTRMSTFGLLPQYGNDYWPQNAKIIQVDINADAVGKTRNVDIGLIGDGGLVCEQLLDMGLTNKNDFHIVTKEIAKMNKNWRKTLDQMTDETENKGDRISPRKALRSIFNNLPNDIVLTTDIGNICSLTNNYINFKNQRSFLSAGTFGSCGTAIPTAMGAQINNEKDLCVAISGDGAWGMSFHELLTAVREKLPIISIVFNNRQWGAEKKNQVIWFGDNYVGTNLENPNFAEIAEKIGCKSYRCNTEEKVRNAVSNAVKNQSNKIPTVIEILGY